MPIDEWLDLLIEHEILYAGMIARCERTDHAVFLYAPELPDFHDANRAVRLRADGGNPEAVAREVVSYYRSRGAIPIADVDPIAEEHGVGTALRQMGIMPMTGERLLMRYGLTEPPLSPRGQVDVLIVPNETGKGEAAVWLETAVADDIGRPDESLWRAVAEREARYSLCRLYLGLLDSRPAGTCDLFEAGGWGRIDSVVTRPEHRRRGVASALVARATADSVTSGNNRTYLFTEAGGAAERLYRSLGFVGWNRNPFRRHSA